MDNWQPSTLSWSFSRKTHLDSCRRHYFYHRFWGQDPKTRWRLYEMRNITTLKMLQGLVVHDVIADALHATAEGDTVSVKQAKKNVTALLRGRYMESQKRLWHIDNRPPGRKASDITNILEHYYRFPDVHDQARQVQQTAWKCVENLLASEMWSGIMQHGQENWKEVEEDSFQSFDLQGIQVYARIDFAHNSDQPTIIDWKTGQPSEQDRKQLVLYSLYAEDKWDWNPLETKLAAVYLQPQLKIDEFNTSDDQIAEVKEEVKLSFAQMVELEPAYGPADIGNFPIAENVYECRRCRFQGICEGAKRLSTG